MAPSNLSLSVKKMSGLILFVITVVGCAVFDQTILVPELNLGQLAHHLRGTFGMNNIESFPKVKGRPFAINEIYRRIHDELVIGGGGALDKR